MLYKLSLDANSISISHRLLGFRTSDVALSNSVARPVEIRCVFNKVFLVNNWHDSFIVVANSYLLVTLISA